MKNKKIFSTFICGLFILQNSIFADGNNYSLRFTEGNRANIPISTATTNLNQFTVEFWYFEEDFSGGDEWILAFERES